MEENKCINITVNVSRTLSEENPNLIAQELATKIRDAAKAWEVTPTASAENTVGDIVQILKTNGLTIRRSLDVLKEVQNQIVLNMPLTSSFDSRL